MKNKKILYVCSAYPHPIDDGIKKINVNLIKEFIQQGHELTLVVPSEHNDTSEEFEKLKIIKYDKKRTIWKLLRNFFLLQPLYFGFYYDSKLLKKINKDNFDLIFYDFYPLTQYSSNKKNELFMMPDSMKQLAWSGFRNENGFVRKLYLFINYLLASQYNKKICGLKKLYVSKEDMKIDLLSKSYFFKIPADNRNFSKYQDNDFNSTELLFRGLMDFEPNITAIKSFYNDVFIHLIEKYPKITMKIVGKNPSNDLINSVCKNSHFTGFVDDIFDEMSQSGIHIVPMSSGTGVKTKMLDSIALKRLVFATSKSINGIFDSIEEAKNNGVIVYENKEEFFFYFDKIMKNELDYNLLVNKAYDFLMQNNYSNKVEELIKMAEEDIN